MRASIACNIIVPGFLHYRSMRMKQNLETLKRAGPQINRTPANYCGAANRTFFHSRLDRKTGESDTALFLEVKQTLAQFDSADAMAFKAERAHIRKVAFAAAFSHGQDVIGVPERFRFPRCQSMRALARAEPCNFFTRRSSAMQSRPQIAQIPRSRSRTRSRR